MTYPMNYKLIWKFRTSYGGSPAASSRHGWPIRNGCGTIDVETEKSDSVLAMLYILPIWVWINTYRYIFSGMNIHLPAILGFTRYQGFDPSPYVPLFIPISHYITHFFSVGSVLMKSPFWPLKPVSEAASQAAPPAGPPQAEKKRWNIKGMWKPMKLAYDWGITIHKPAILGYLGYVLTHSHIHRIIMGHKMVKSPMNGSCYKN